MSVPLCPTRLSRPLAHRCACRVTSYPLFVPSWTPLLNAALSVCKRWSDVIMSMRNVLPCARDVSDASPSFPPLLSLPRAPRHVGARLLSWRSLDAKEIAMLADPLLQLSQMEGCSSGADLEL